jgi:hypothetical protein
MGVIYEQTDEKSLFWLMVLNIVYKLFLFLFRKEMNLQQSLSSLKEELAKADQTLRNKLAPILTTIRLCRHCFSFNNKEICVEAR